MLRFPGLVYGGCLVKSLAAADLGFTGDADRAAWPAAIRGVRARYIDDAAIVPGHGPVDLSGQAISTRRLLETARSASAAAKSRLPARPGSATPEGFARRK